ncbi:type 1 fimbrial protein [Salmonella enterica subsp. enterica serovar Ball]|nr:type 1 fimbrial protein [Salmonella enterica subsp. enterica serovar Ball]
MGEEQNMKTMFLSVLLVLLVWSGGVFALQLDGKATMQGAVVASGCSIALSDRFQTVSMGEYPLRHLQSSAGYPVRNFVIRLENCSPWASGADPMRQTDPAIRVRFDGVQGARPYWFRTGGSARGVSLVLRDDRQELVYPGGYSSAIYQKAYNQQFLKYTLELVPDGSLPKAGDYYAVLRFNIAYE